MASIPGVNETGALGGSVAQDASQFAGSDLAQVGEVSQGITANAASISKDVQSRKHAVGLAAAKRELRSRSAEMYESTRTNRGFNDPNSDVVKSSSSPSTLCKMRFMRNTTLVVSTG